MNGRDVFGAIWRRKYVALLVLVLTLVATGAYVLTAPKTYRARATLTLVPPTQTAAQAAAGNQNLGDFNAVSGPLLSTLADVAVSEPVLADAARRLNPTISTTDLRKKVIGSGLLQTLILRVEATDGNAKRSADIANAVAQALIQDNPSVKLGVLSLVDPASSPESAVSPNKTTSLAIGLILGLVLAAAAAAAVDRRRTQVVGGILDVEQALNAPVLARLGTAGKGDPDGEVRALVARLHPEMSQSGRMAVVVLEAEATSGLPHISEQLALAFYDGHSQVLALHGPHRTAMSPSQMHQPMETALSAAGHPSGGVATSGSPAGTRQLASSIYELTVDERISDEQVSHAIAAFDVVVADARDSMMRRYLPELLRNGSVLLIVRLSTARRSQLRRMSRQLKEDGTAISGVVLT